jgi:BirA family biotin operon repressor/biotin-[acetyl-CoA-carboxylase] ligase
MLPPTERPALRESVLRELLLAPAGPLARVSVVERTGSTNADLARALREEPDVWPSPSLLVAEAQEAGRGRAGRTWETPPRASLAVSFAVRPSAPLDTFGWLPLLAGLGAVNALRATVGVPAVLKWPNDLMVPAPDGATLEGWGELRKVGGILTELVAGPGGPAVVVGIGLNVSQTPDELPVPSATSLQLVGGRDVDREMLLVALVAALAEVTARWSEAGGDARAAGLLDDVSAVCATLGTQVRVELPGGHEVTGTARRLDGAGALVVVGPDGVEHQVLAGDVHHVRTAV